MLVPAKIPKALDNTKQLFSNNEYSILELYKIHT